jgi:hypothetical protein
MLLNWSVINSFEGVNDSLNSFVSLFNDILDQHAPIKKVKLSTSSSKLLCHS